MPEETMSAFAPPKANLEGVAAVAAGTFTPADRGTRLAAVMLDGLMSLPGAVMFVVPVVMMRAGGGSKTPGIVGGIAMVVASLYFLAFLVYQVYLLSTRGQTLGKRWMKIKVIKLDGSNPGFVGAVLLRIIVNGVISVVPYLGGIYGLVDSLFIFREDRRCVHDLIAGTRVVVAS
jgi:uncharacterized RDD family membrane protein YckC